MELEVTWGRAAKVWWAYLWRNLIALVVGMILGGVMGFVLGIIMGALGFEAQTIQYVITPIGFLMGIAISIVPIKMILGKDFGQFRLVLVSKE